MRFLLPVVVAIVVGPFLPGAAAAQQPLCPTCPIYTVGVTPDAPSTPDRALNTTITTDSFTVRNTGNQPDSYIISCSTSSHLTCEITTPTFISLDVGEAHRAGVSYTTVAVGTGVLSVRARSDGSPADHTGSLSVPVVRYGVTVTPDGAATPTRVVGLSYATDSFTVTNTGSKTQTFSVSCASSVHLQCTSAHIGNWSLGAGASQKGAASYSTVAGGTGTVTITATGTNATDNGSFIVPIQAAAPTVTLVVPGAGARTVVHNRQPVIRALLKPAVTTIIDTTLTVLRWRGETVTSLARHNRGVLEWEVDSTRWLGVGDSAVVEVTACAFAVTGCTTVSRLVVLENDEKPVLGFTGMPLGNLHGGFGAPFGPGLSVSGAEVETGLSIPSYTSMGLGRSAGLVYSTRQSYPRALINVDLELPWPAGTPNQVKLVLSEAGTGLDSVTLASPTCATGATQRCRATLQADFGGSTFASPVRKWLTVEARVTSGATTRSATDSVEVVIVDRRATRYGAGWWPAGVSRLVGAGGDRVVVGSTGTAVIYRGHGDSVYVPPPGIFTALVKTANGWELRPRGSLAKTVFDADGRLIATVDVSGNADSVRYDGAIVDKVLALRDPVGGLITFAYNGSGFFTHWTDPAGRQSRVTLGANNQLVADSISSPTSRPNLTTFVYQSYPGTNTAVLAKRIGVVTDTTIVTYDSTFRRRPVQSRLPRVQDDVGTWVNPVITYGAYERRGYGALASLDSVYVEMKDPRNHWTRSLLNRWAQSRKAWDSLGLLSRASYTAEGFVLWSEGKNGDSSRVYTVYDAARRAVKTYIVRGSTDTLRADSVVYDANHRVVQQIDAQGRVWKTVYDALGRVTQTIRPNTPIADTAYTWYNSRGLPDSTGHRHHTLASRFHYDTLFNVIRVTDHGGDTVTVNIYDALGRLTTARSRTPLQLAGATTWWQWQRVETWFNSASQVDSTRIGRSDSSSTVGFAPTWPAASDTLKTQRVAHRYDRAGRDSLRLNDRGTATMYLYDRLGRLVSRRPWTDSMAVKDSMAYDVAGNLKKSVTRRGHTITTNYDSRNRDTLSVIPTVGTLRKQFSGPLDQLTRMWYDSPVDSIGGVNGEVRYGYDQRGRLRADTAYTGSTARVTSYVYDMFERPSTATDALGTWTTLYETARGYADTLKTPLGDTVVYAYDDHGRAIGPSVYSGGLRHGAGIGWKENETLQSLDHTTQTGSGPYTAGLYKRPALGDSGYVALSPAWVEQHGYGTARDSITAAVAYDGWNRLTSWTDAKNGGTVKTETYAFDRAGNISTELGGAVHDAGTDRLLQRNELAGVTRTFKYDRAGNQTNNDIPGKLRVYGYDALNRLVSIRRNGTLIARYAYDVLGRRIAKRVYAVDNGGTVAYTRFVHRGNHVGYETDSTGTIGFRYTWGLGTDQLVAFRDGAGTHYYVATDRVGSVRTVVKRDGTWVMSQRFTPYGVLLARDSAGATTPALRYGWTGRELDEESSFHYLRNRYYSNVIRRFNQEDKIGFVGGTNLYAYVGGNPLEGRDPTGTMTENGGAGGLSMICDATCYDGIPGNETWGGGGGSGGGSSLAPIGLRAWPAPPPPPYASGRGSGPSEPPHEINTPLLTMDCKQRGNCTQSDVSPHDIRVRPGKGRGPVGFIGTSSVIAIGKSGWTGGGGLYCTSWFKECGVYWYTGDAQGAGFTVGGGEAGFSTSTDSFGGYSSGGCAGATDMGYCRGGNQAGTTHTFGSGGFSVPVPYGYKFQTTTEIRPFWGK